MAKKYIDADRLRAEMEKRMHICDGVFERNSDTYYQGKAVAYQETLSFIDSLQQEQPIGIHDIGVEGEKGADGSLVLQEMEGFFRNSAKGEMQDQPCEDLEAEMGKYFDGWHDDPEYGQAVLPHTYECVGVSDCKDIARHFYELGKQSKEPVSEDLRQMVNHIWKCRGKGDPSQLVLFSYDEVSSLMRTGATWQKQQMLKDAVEGVVVDTGKRLVVRYDHYCGPDKCFYEIKYFCGLSDKEFKEGDKVKIVIVKED